ncbi:hypothetical protein JTB14_009023 [Gonioctena quinquepunctata]|nr:hypothetical protein JTB14_009023 [Gonioctena quinquepunctata]
MAFRNSYPIYRWQLCAGSCDKPGNVKFNEGTQKNDITKQTSQDEFRGKFQLVNDEVSPIINLPDHDNIDSDKAEHSGQDNLQIVHNIILCFRLLSEYTQEIVEVEGHITVGSME